MSLNLEVNGVKYQNFMSASCETNLDTIAGSFSFEIAAPGTGELPFKVNDTCRVLVNDKPVLTGFIEGIEVSYSAGDHTLYAYGRSKTGDIVDSSIDNLELNAGITLKTVIENVITHLGLDIQVIDNANALQTFTLKKQTESVDRLTQGTIVEAAKNPANQSGTPFKQSEDVLSAEVGENAFDFIEKTARKRQVLLTTNGNGDIVIERSGTEQLSVGLQNFIGGIANNIVSSSVGYDFTALYSRYVVRSQQNTTTPGVLAAAQQINSKMAVNQKSTVIADGDISRRQFVIIAENASSDSQLEVRGQWEANIRKARSRQYTATVQGYDNGEDIWRINMLVDVFDEFAGITEIMLINSVTYSLDLSGGSITTMTLVDKNAYTLQLEEGAGNLGESFA